ncbi:MAG: DUF433 domain-containing protein [Planctomycetes bacterium]|nr:DUF433 domain-containing protein [Planctomycetota bacterium]
MDKNLISINPRVCGGSPCIAGTRIMVSTILSRISGGDSLDDIVRAYPQLSREQVVTAVDYAISVVRDEEVEVLSQG